MKKLLAFSFVLVSMVLFNLSAVNSVITDLGNGQYRIQKTYANNSVRTFRRTAANLWVEEISLDCCRRVSIEQCRMLEDALRIYLDVCREHVDMRHQVQDKEGAQAAAPLDSPVQRVASRAASGDLNMQDSASRSTAVDKRPATSMSGQELASGQETQEPAAKRYRLPDGSEVDPKLFCSVIKSLVRGQPSAAAPQAAGQPALQQNSQEQESGASSANMGQGNGHEATQEDEKLKTAIQMNLAFLPRPQREYVESVNIFGQVNISEEVKREVVLQCDEINKGFGFDPKNPLITQLPSLYQNYEGLKSLPEYGNQYGLLCGYYAAHAAKIFAANPHATREELINLLNNREAFERETLIPGKLKILSERPEKDRSESGFANLLGEEIENLLSSEVRERTIIIGASPQTGRLQNEDSIAREKLLVQRFKNGEIDYLIYIIPNDSHNHWIPVLVRRDANQQVCLILTDSIGSDRTRMKSVIEIYQNLDTVSEMIRDANAYLDQIEEQERLRRRRLLDCIVM